MIGRLLDVASLTLIFVLLGGRWESWNFVLGAALSAALLFAFRRYLPAHPGVHRPLRLAALAAKVAWDIAVGTVAVAAVVLGIRPLRPGVVEVPFAERSDGGVEVSAFLITLTPGTFVVAIDWEGRKLLVHALDAADGPAVVETQQRFYRRWQRPAFP